MEPEYEYEYEQKCERITMQLEMFVLDAILNALERLNYYNQQANADKKESSEDTQPF
jgi:hypothetical protein